jgi:hypothetical protein
VAMIPRAQRATLAIARAALVFIALNLRHVR